MKPEKQQLIHDLFDDHCRRDATLLAGTGALRHRRHRRLAGQILIATVLVIAAVLSLESNKPHASAGRVMVPAPKAAGPQARSLTDDELLALFPNTPVGLATLPNGKKMLIFPRPGDEAKYVIRL